MGNDLRALAFGETGWAQPVELMQVYSGSEYLLSTLLNDRTYLRVEVNDDMDLDVLALLATFCNPKSSMLILQTDGLQTPMSTPAGCHNKPACHASYGMVWPDVAKFYGVIGTCRDVSGSDAMEPIGLREMIGPIAPHNASDRNLRQPSCRMRSAVRGGAADNWKVTVRNFYENKPHSGRQLLGLTMRIMTLICQQFAVTDAEVAEMRALADEVMDYVLAPGPQYGHMDFIKMKRPYQHMYVTRSTSRTAWTWGGVAIDRRRIRRSTYVKPSRKRSQLIENDFTQVYTLKNRDYLLGRAMMPLMVTELEIMMSHS